MEKFNIIQFTEKLTQMGERQLEVETRAFELIIKTLRENSVEFCLQEFNTFVPQFKENQLLVDGKEIESKPTGFFSGKVDRSTILNSLESSQPFIDQSNINFSPSCSVISKNNFYFAPSLAIKASDKNKIAKAKNIQASIEVKKTKFTSRNIIVGNLIEPTNVFFAHYDSIGPGAIDNASGVALLLKLIIDYPGMLRNNLFVLSGNEELSYDYPVYWGRGYREFEDKYYDVLEKSKKIFVVDCIGYSKPIFSSKAELVKLAFPLKKVLRLNGRVSIVSGDFDELMQYYHSDNDIPANIDLDLLIATLNSLLKKMA